MQARPLWNLNAHKMEGVDLRKMAGDAAYRVSGSAVELGLWREKSLVWSWADWVFLEKLPEAGRLDEVSLATIRAGNVFRWELSLRNGHAVAVVDALSPGGPENSRRRFQVEGVTALPQTGWIHLAVTSESGFQKLFVNGALAGEVVGPPTASLQLAALSVNAISEDARTGKPSAKQPKSRVLRTHICWITHLRAT